MTETQKPLPIVQALNEVMKAVGGVKKSDRNTSQNFNFRGIDAVVNAVAPQLQKYGVVVMPTVLDYEYNSIEIGQRRTVMGHVKVKVSYTFYGSTGDSLSTTVVGEAMDAGDKATAKAMSVAFRTALLQSLSLPTDDVDPDAHSYERSSAAPEIDADKVLIQIMEAQDIDTLAKVGQFITTNKASFDAATLEMLRSNFQKQQKEITPVKQEAIDVPVDA